MSKILLGMFMVAIIYTTAAAITGADVLGYTNDA